MKIKELITKIENQKARSKWSKGVNAYSVMLLEALEGTDEISKDIEYQVLKKMLLNGAEDWLQYSYGGWALIYDSDIAQMLSTPTELKRTCNGKKKPNRREEWLDTQARALYQAFNRIWRTLKSTC